ncbi:hypothetical protein [Pontivivens ytuae]|uniref:Holin-X, holin superfamily III n=1 Tax=Pontivivens ytuae TaxID=2789856 RepID=A0A7S9LV27_9RHOB|nr:hypothetical protein [Pontivivens ytuae]QPH55525.1 hypothetical protein I0K15_07250 [Pontivivens ytuae]
MLSTALTGLTAQAAYLRKRIVSGIIAGILFVGALGFGVAAGLIWLIGLYGAIIACAIVAGALFVLGLIVLLLGRRRKVRVTPPPAAATPALAGSALTAQLIEAFLVGAQIGRGAKR